MCLAAVALRVAFSYEPYRIRDDTPPSTISHTTVAAAGRIVTMQSISNNLKETMNPRDIMHGNTRQRPRTPIYQPLSPLSLSLLL
jgi:hypothetical protein